MSSLDEDLSRVITAYESSSLGNAEPSSMKKIPKVRTLCNFILSNRARFPELAEVIEEDREEAFRLRMKIWWSLKDYEKQQQAIHLTRWGFERSTGIAYTNSRPITRTVDGK